MRLDSIGSTSGQRSIGPTCPNSPVCCDPVVSSSGLVSTQHNNSHHHNHHNNKDSYLCLTLCLSYPSLPSSIHSCLLAFLPPITRIVADDEMVKIFRLRKTEGNDGDVDSDDFSQQLISGVRFAPLLTYPRMPTIIHATVWEPALHQSYPDSFQKASKTILMCGGSDPIQPEPKPRDRRNVAAMLPPAIWMEILSFTHRHCKSARVCARVCVVVNSDIHIYVYVCVYVSCSVLLSFCIYNRPFPALFVPLLTTVS